jgi:hypothetical protein
LVRISDIRAGTVADGTPESQAKQRETAQSTGTEEFGAYLADIESHAKIERNPKVFE